MIPSVEAYRLIPSNVTDANTTDNNLSTSPVDIDDAVEYWFYSDFYVYQNDSDFSSSVIVSAYISASTTGGAPWHYIQIQNPNTLAYDSFLSSSESTGGKWYNVSVNSTYINSSGYINVRSSEWTNTAGFTRLVDLYELQASIDAPDLYSPTNTSALSKDYPPLTEDINFTWSLSSSSSNIIVSTDINFNLISVDIVTSNNYSVQSLEAGDYWWKVCYYNTTLETCGNWSATFNFTLTNTVSSSGKAGIQGVIYEDLSGVNTPISGAIVYINNAATNWSSFQITGSNGYYNFDNLTNGTTYNIYATKTGYVTSPTEYVTTGNGVWSTKDIFLRKCISELECGLSTHYVNFIVQNLWGTKYSNVAVTVYKGSDITASDSGTTGSDGAVAFFLTKDQPYRMTFINASQGISHTVTSLTPSDSQYYIIVSQTVPSWGDDTSVSEAVTVVLTSQLIGTTGYINVTWNNSVAGTTGLIFYLNQTNKTNGSAPQINIETINAGAVGNYTATFTGIANAGSKDYVVNIKSTHSTYGTIYRTYGVQFIGLPSTALDFIPAALKALFAIATIIFVGALAGHSSRAQMAGMCCVLAWVFIFIGFFSYFDTTPIIAGTTIATIITVIWNMNERQSQEQI